MFLAQSRDDSAEDVEYTGFKVFHYTKTYTLAVTVQSQYSIARCGSSMHASVLNCLADCFLR
jgi:hypothetical protein